MFSGGGCHTLDIDDNALIITTDRQTKQTTSRKRQNQMQKNLETRNSILLPRKGGTTGCRSPPHRTRFNVKSERK